MSEDRVQERMTTLRTDLEENLIEFLNDSSKFAAKIVDDFDSYGKNVSGVRSAIISKAPNLITMAKGQIGRGFRPRQAIEKELIE